MLSVLFFFSFFFFQIVLSRAECSVLWTWVLYLRNVPAGRQLADTCTLYPRDVSGNGDKEFLLRSFDAVLLYPEPCQSFGWDQSSRADSAGGIFFKEKKKRRRRSLLYEEWLSTVVCTNDCRHWKKAVMVRRVLITLSYCIYGVQVLSLSLSHVQSTL